MTWLYIGIIIVVLAIAVTRRYHLWNLFDPNYQDEQPPEADGYGPKKRKQGLLSRLIRKIRK